MDQKLNLNKSINAATGAISSNKKEFEEFIKVELTEILKIKVSEDEKKSRKLKAKNFIRFAEQILHPLKFYINLVFTQQQSTTFSKQLRSSLRHICLCFSNSIRKK
jgi:hypothetical protein